MQDNRWSAVVTVHQVMPNQFQKGVIGPCPDNKVYCGSFSCGESCTVGGTCVQGKCYCNLEYTGDSCGKKLTPDGNYTNYVPVVDGGSPSGGGAVYDDGFIMVSSVGVMFQGLVCFPGACVYVDLCGAYIMAVVSLVAL